MSDEINFQGVRYISAREAALVANVTRDYVARLARSHKVRARRVGKNWYVEEASLKNFLVEQEYFHAKRKTTLMHDRKREYEKATREPAAEQSSEKTIQPEKARELKAVSSMRSALENVIAKKHTPAQHLRVSPLYAAHPAFDLAHKVTALIAAFVLVFGAYSYVYPDAARFALDAMRSVVANSESAVDENAYANDQFAAAAETSIIGRFSNFVRGLFGIERGLVYVTVEPFKPTVAQEPKPQPVTPLESRGPLTGQVERVRETIRTVSGITEEMLEARLAVLLQDFRDGLQFTSNTSLRQDVIISDSVGDFIGGTLEDLTIIDSSWTGGTITNATITGGSVTATAFSGILPEANGGTGTSTYATGDLLYADAADSLSTLAVGSNGQVLKVAGGTLQWSSDLQGSGGAGAWATSTNEMFLYPADPNDIVIIGSDATSTTGNILEVVGNSLFRGLLTAYNTITGPRFVATSSVASVFPYASSTAFSVSGTGYFETASTTNLTVSGAAGGILKTSATGAVSVAVAGTDYESPLTFTYPLTRSTNTISLAFGTTTANTWSQLQTFTSILAQASSTIGSGAQAGGLTISGGATTTGFLVVQGNATSTFLGGISALRLDTTATSTLAGVRLTNILGCSEALETNAFGDVVCGTDATSAGAAADFTFATNYNVLTAATTSPIWAQSGIFASSTSHFAGADFLSATTTTFAITGLNGPLDARNGIVSATTSIGVLYGGTGLTSIGNNQLIIGNSSGGFTAIATSTLFSNSSQLASWLSDETGTGNFVLSNSPTLTGTASFASILASASTTLRNFTFVSATGTEATTTNFAVSSISPNSLVKTTTGGALVAAVAGTDYANFAFPFTTETNYGVTVNSTTTPLWGRNGIFASSTSHFVNLDFASATSTGLSYFNNGLISSASTTIGNGTQAGGLTISGGATTTGNQYIAGTLGVGIIVPTKTFEVTGTGRVSSTFTLGSVTGCTGGQALQTNGSGDIACGTVATGGTSSAGGWTTDNIGSVTLSTTTDRVGIGATSTPYAKLSILSGAAGTTTLALIPASAQTANIIDIYNTSGVLSSVFTSGGKLGISTTTPFAKLAVQGTLFQSNPVFEVASSSDSVKFLSVAGNGFGTTTLSGLTINGSATSTSNVGYNITSGCFAVNDVCITSSGANGSDFTFENNFGVLTAATTSPIWARAGIFASSTSHFVTLDFTSATSTGLSYFNNGLISSASTTIGNGSQAGGLTVSGGATTTGNILGQGTLTISGATTLNGTLTATGGLSTLSNLLATGSSTLQNFTFVNATGSAATTTNLAVSSIAAGSLVKTTTGGALVAAVAGTDYQTFAFPFTPTSNFGVTASATGTPLLLTAGLSASTTVRFGDAGGSQFIFNSSTGKLGLGTSTPFAKLAVQGTLLQTNPIFEVASSSDAIKFLSVAGDGFGTTTLSGLNIAGSATSTSNVGFALTSGCFSVGGTCIKSVLNGVLDDLTDVVITTPALGNFLSFDGTNWVNLATSTLFSNSSQLASWLSDETGTGNFVLSNSPTLTGTASFASILASASTTLRNFTFVSATGTEATTTNLAVSSIASGSLVKTTTGGALIAAVAGTDYSLPHQEAFSFVTHFGALTAATTSPVRFTNNLFASSTVRFGAANGTQFLFDSSTGKLGLGTTSPYANLAVQATTTQTNPLFEVASTSNAHVFFSIASTGSTTLYQIPSQILTTNANGTIIGSSTLSVSYGGTGLSTAPTFGQLLVGNSLGGYTLTATSSLGLIGEGFRDWSVQGNGYLAPTTTRGILVNASSTIGDGTQAGGLTVSGGATTTGNILGQGTLTISGATTLNGTLTATGGLSTLSNLLATGSSTLQNFTFVNATGSAATTTNLAVSSIAAGSLVKTTTGGALIAAVAGTDYSNFAFPFTPTSNFGVNTNATSTPLSLFAGVNASSTSRFDNLAVYGQLNFATTSLKTPLAVFNGAAFITASSTAQSTSVGELALANITNGIRNTALGYRALGNATSSSANTAVGYEALECDAGTDCSGIQNTAVGFQALTGITTGSGNAAFGYTALGGANVTSSNNAAFGWGALLQNSSGGSNSAFGKSAMQSNSTGQNNVAVGTSALDENGTGNNQVIIGSNALTTATSTSGNVAIGFQALTNLITGPDNDTEGSVVLGSDAGSSVTYGGGNILLGFQAGNALTTGSRNILIGYDIDAPSNTASNQLSIGNLLFGTGIDGTGTTLSSGKIGVGTTSPYAKLAVQAGGVQTNPLFEIASTSSATKFLSVAGGGFGTTTLTGLTISGSATSTSNVGFKITSGCYETVSGSCLSAGSFVSGAGNGQPSGTSRVAHWSDANTITSTAGFTFDSTTLSAPELQASAQNPFLYVNDSDTATADFQIAAFDGQARISVDVNNSEANSYLGFNIDATERMRLSGGFLGIGTSTPRWQLQVASSTGPQFALSDGSLTSSHWGFRNAGSNLYLDTISPSTYATSSLSKFTILGSNGNIGVGTTSPYAKLSVVGPVVAEYFHGTSTSATSTFAGGLNVGSGALVHDFSAGLTSIENLAIGALTFDTDAGIVSWADMPVTSAAATGTIESYSAQIDGTSILTIFSRAGNNGGIYTPSVGIGSTTPWGTFSVEQEATATTSPIFVVGDQGTSTPHLLVHQAKGFVGIGTTTPWARLSINPIAGDAAAFVVGSSTSGTLLAVQPSGTTTMKALHVTGTGANATSTVEGNFHVKGTLQVGAGSVFLSEAGIETTAATTFNLSSSAGQNISFNDDDLVVNTASGNTGIGTSSPYSKLTVWGNDASAATKSFEVTNNASTTLFSISNTGIASTTSLVVSSAGGAAGCATFSSTGLISNTGTACGSGGGGASDFTFENNFGVLSAATTSAIWAKSGIFASSTSHFVNLDFTSATATGLSYFNNGLISSASTTIGSGTQTSGLTISGGATTTGNALFQGTVTATGNILTGGTLRSDSSSDTSVIARGIASSNFSADLKLESGGSNSITFFRQNDEVGRFSSSGNLGIGTTTPYAKLSVVGEVVARNFTATSSNATSTFTNFVATGNASTSNLIVSNLNAADCDVKASTAGVLSCGTDATGAGGGAFPFTPSTFGATAVNSTTTALQLQGGLFASSTVRFGTSGKEGFFLDTSNGRVGIGSTTPWAQLSINPDNIGTAPAFAIGSSTQTLFSVTPNGAGSIFNFGARATSTIAFNSAFAWTIATTTTGNASSTLFRIDTTAGAEQVVLGYGTSDVIIGDSGAGSNLVFEENSTIKGQGSGRLLTFGANSDRINFGVNVGIGTSTPWAKLSVVSGALSGDMPAFVVATTSAIGPGQRPLLWVGATTTGKLDYARVAIGTTSPWGNAGLRDQLTVDGRLYTTWRYVSCDAFGGNLTATALSADTANVCGPFMYDEDTDADLVVSTGNVPAAEIRTGQITIAQTTGDGGVIRLAQLVTSATTSPVIEVWGYASTSRAATSTPLYIIGFHGGAIAQDTGVVPANGIYFAASSTATWKAITRKTNVETMTDTGIATSTNFGYQKFRIEASDLEAVFLINGNVVAQHGITTIPVTNLAPVVSAGIATASSGNAAALAPRFSLSLIRFWMDDPPGGLIADAGNIALEDVFDPVQGADIAEAYLADDPGKFIPGAIVSNATSTEAHMIVRASGRYDSQMMGVVATSPHMVLGDEASTTVRVGMVGRVPVIVSLENGAIAKGDAITSSSLAGVGMKAARPGAVVGKTIEEFDPQNGKKACDPMLKDELIAAGYTLPSDGCYARVLVVLDTGFDMGIGNLVQDASEFASTTISATASIGEALAQLLNSAFDQGAQLTKFVVGQIVAKVGIFERVFAKTLYAENVYADTVNAKKFCLDGLCVTRDQLQQLLDGQVAGSSTEDPDDSGGEPPQEGAPVIELMGANPVHLTVGDSYVDSGATITGPEDDTDLGISASVDGATTTSVSNIQIDTSAAGEHTIVFTAIDEDGNIGTATRTVIVGSAEEAEDSEEPPTETPPTESASSTPPVAEPTSEPEPTPEPSAPEPPPAEASQE